MAGKKKAQPKTEYEEFEDDDAGDGDWDDSAGDDEAPASRPGLPPGVKLRDWRDVERHREDRELRRALGDDYDVDDDDDEAPKGKRRR